MRFALGLGAFIVTTGFRLYHQKLSRWEGVPMSGGYEEKIYKHKGTVTEVRVGINYGTPFEFIIRPERGWDSALKGIGLAEEIQTGDEDFDNAFYIVSDEVELGHQLRQKARLREIVQQLFALQISEMHIGRGRMWVRFMDQPDAISVTARARAGELLKQLAEQLGEARQIIDTYRRKPTGWIAAGFMACHLGFLVAGIGMLVFCTTIIDFWQLIFSAAGVGLLIGISWALVVCAVMGKSSRVNLVLFDFVVVGLAGVCMSSAGALASYNIEYDSSEPELAFSTVTDKYTRKGRRSSRSYYVCVEHWKRAKEEYCFKVNSSEYYSANIGNRVVLTLRAGALSYEWMEKYQFTVAR